MFQDSSPHLLYLVWLRVVAFALYIDPLLNSLFAEKVMATFHPPIEAEIFQQGAQVIKTDRGIGGSAKDSLQRFRVGHRHIVNPGSSLPRCPAGRDRISNGRQRLHAHRGLAKGAGHLRWLRGETHPRAVKRVGAAVLSDLSRFRHWLLVLLR